MVKPKLWLHIGAGKTGTSAVQAAFACLETDLEKQKICYPNLAKFSFESAKKSLINSGNINTKADPEQGEWPNKIVNLISSMSDKYEQFIFSNEGLHTKMVPFFEKLNELESLCEIHILLSCRNPFDVVISGYHQEVKRSCFCGSFEEYLESKKYRSQAIYLARLVEKIRASNIHLHLLNYSNYRKNITLQIFNIIGIDNLLDRQTAARSVNRSLTEDELNMCLVANRVALTEKWEAPSYADLLINNHPDLRAFKEFTLTSKAFNRFREVNSKSVEYLNSHLSDDDLPLELVSSSITTECVTPPEDRIHVTKESFGLFVKSIYEYSASSLVSKNKKMPIDLFRCLLNLLINEESQLSPEARQWLMNLLLTARPGHKKLKSLAKSLG